MASTIKIKRSSINTSPSSLKSGELAYSWAAGGNRLYFGKGDDGSGNATEIIVIGGQYFTDLLDHTPGTLTTSSAIITDANNKINELFVDNLKLDVNVISSTNLDGNIELNPNGNGLVSIAGAYTLPRTASTAGYVLTYNGSGAVTFQPVSTTLSINADNNVPDSVNLLTDTLIFTGGEGIDTSVTNNTITISAEDASSSNKGVASFTSTDFSVTSGNVSLIENRIRELSSNGIAAGEGIDVNYNTSTFTITISGEIASDTNAGIASFSNDNFAVDVTGLVTIKDGGVSNAELVNSSITVGSTAISLGSSSTTIAGLTQIDINNIRITGNTISSTNPSGNIVFDPDGTGTVEVSGARITGVAEPLNSTDAATKAYVDAVAEGLHVHAPVKAATTNTLAILSGGTVTYDNGTDGVGATLTLSVGITILDGYTIQNGDRVLIKDEVTAAHNGIYIWATGGTVLTRAEDFNTILEVAGGDFLFVQEGDIYANTGWVETETTTAIGTSDIIFLQFSGAGSYQAGQGLLLNGSVFNINTASNSGLYISGNVLQIDPTLAGNGLTYNNGIMAVGGTTDRISVTADAIDIASTYVGQTSITTVGTITSGTWNATTIAAAYGGTGQTTYNYGDLLYGNVGGSLSKLAMGGVGKILQVSTSSELVYGDIDGGTY